MHKTSIKRTLTLAGFAPAGKLSHAFWGLPPVLELLAARLGKLNWGKRAWALLALCAATAIALPAQTFTTLVSFDGTDGANPYAGLVQATDGSLYGTTYAGGAYLGIAGTPAGTAFKITPSGTLTTLYNFCAIGDCIDGDGPYAGLVQSTNGKLYGTTAFGGAGYEGQFGMVFQISLSGTLTTLYSFCASGSSCAGALPVAGLVQSAHGDLYGTTSSDLGQVGTVFKITPSGTFTTLYTFCSQSGCADGEGPAALVQATNGDFYGTTMGGGAYGYGTVFKITPGGALTTLYSFCSQSGCPDGENPQAALVQATNGDFYGTTRGGGNCANCGTVFKITPSGTLTKLHSFDYTDGFSPYAALVQATDGDLYGTTAYGGAYGTGDGLGGTLFKITPRGTLTTLYNFCAETGCTDGGEPYAALVQDTNGILYGTTFGGGANGLGTVFSLSVGLGPFVETRLTAGTVGAAVEILGSDLAGATSVSFDGTAAVFELVSSSLIVTKVPVGASTGKVEVVTPSGTLSSNVPFRVLL